MSDDSSQARYVEVSARLNTINLVGAWLISGLMLVATWGNWRSFAAVVAVQATLVPFNAWVTLSLLKRRKVASAELIRTIVNLSGTMVVGVLTQWPLPMWLWLPYVALAFDHLGQRVARRMLIATSLVQVAGGLWAGVHWLYPLVFVTLAVFCSELSRIRFQVIRSMLVTSDAQRAELEEAHAQLHTAHEELTQATRAREQVEVELRHANKLEAVGRLASGIAHEINTPVQFVGDSLHFFRDGSADLLRLAAVYRKLGAGLTGAELEAGLREARALEEELDLDFLETELPAAVARSQEGLERITVIVRSMKEFAHPDAKEAREVDLNSAINSTLTIARGEYKHVAKLQLQLGDIPLVSCHAGEINQVVLNLLVNAAHAIADKRGSGSELGTITVATRSDGDDVVISIGDTGCGIPEGLRERIFEPFFTTKEVGRGTGQGLALARAIVLRHGGQLTFDTALGVGTTFHIRLPTGSPRTSIAA